MSAYKNINFTYDKQALLDMFNQSNKVSLPHQNNADLEQGASANLFFDLFFNHFNFVPRNDKSIDLSEIVSWSAPHVTPNNNGVIILPVSGTVALKFYSYVSPKKDDEGRPVMDTSVMSPELLAEIEATQTELVNVTTPIVIDGLTTHSYGVTDSSAVVFVLKIPKGTKWEDAVAKVS